MSLINRVLQLSSSNLFGKSSGSQRRGPVSGSREALTAGNDSRTPEGSSATVNKISIGQKSLPAAGSSDPRHISARNNYDSTIKGIEGLHFDDEDKNRH